MTTLVDAHGNGAKPTPAYVLVAIPCGDQMPSRTAYDLARLLEFTTSFGWSDLNTGILAGHRLVFDYGTLIAPQRRAIVHQALGDERVTHILWVDSDMRFPKNGLLRLLGHRKPIVAANYATRRNPVYMTAFRTLKRGDHVYTEEASTGLEAVAGIGFGFVLTTVDVFRKTEPPWFSLDWTGAGFEGEDITFCRRAHRAGYDVWVDHDLSKEVRHIGQRELSYQAALVNRELIAAEEAANAENEAACAARERALGATP